MDISIAIFDYSEREKLNTDEILMKDKNFLPQSADRLKCFITFEGQSIPNCLYNLTTLQGIYSYNEWTYNLANTPEWNVKY
jgi:hypothetical protein